MGNCIHSRTDDVNHETPRRGRRGSGQRATVGKNHPLKKERPKWKSDVPMTEDQVRSKREEFWHTAPAFEGRKEIWDALKAAVFAVESSDHPLAQAIIDGANITLPNGTLSDCYDELGTRYQLPYYVISYPVNMLSREEAAAVVGAIGDVEDDSGTAVSGPVPSTSSSGNRAEMMVRCRLSTGRELKVTARPSYTVLRMKRLIEADTGFEVTRQRWFCFGQRLDDRLRLDECKIPKGFIVQVVVHSPCDSADQVLPLEA